MRGVDLFDKEYKRLNQAQKIAVDNIDGPLLVLAGPGTGKTQILAMRVANIIKRTDTSPESILCLTFTNKAAVNMKDRIINLTRGAGSKTVVKTFHSFAAEIMNSYPDNFWNHANLSIAPETVQLDVIESVLEKLPLDNPLSLKFAGQYTLTAEIQNAINLAKDAGLTPEKLTNIIEANLKYLNIIEPQIVEIFKNRLTVKTIDEYVNKIYRLPKQKNTIFNYPLLPLNQVLLEKITSAVKTDKDHSNTKRTSALKHQLVQLINGGYGMHKEKALNAWWRELAQVYRQYRDIMHGRGYYDYADMLVEVITQLESSPSILADIQERFLYVLVDEFQDSNPAQLRFAQLISEHYTAEGKPNLMVVGDDDQSIYKFNGAELSNTLNFKRQYPSARIVVLQENYRSSQFILDVSKKVIELTENRLVNQIEGISKDLLAINDYKSIVAFLSYNSREEQIDDMSEKVKKSFIQGKNIAVLARNHDSLVKMVAALDQIGVPISYERRSNVLEHEVVVQTYLIIKLCDAILHGNKELVNQLTHQIIRHPVWGIAPRALWQLARSNFNKPDWLNSLMKSSEKTLSNLSEWFLWLAQESTRQPLAVIIEHVIGLRKSDFFASPIKNYFTKDKDNLAIYFTGLSAIQLLRALVKDFSKNPQPNLSDFIRFMEVNINNNKIIADESPFVTGDKSVKLLSVHKAKGLEFDQVYIIDAVEKNWQPKRGTKKPPLNLPLQPVGDDNDDYVRLMYVAMTRAKQDLFISGYRTDHAGNETALTPMLTANFNIEKIPPRNQKSMIKILETSLHWPDLQKASEKEILKARLETYNLSVTDLINFLDVTKGGPRYFKEKNLLRLPEVKNPHMAHGTAMHAAMEHAQILTNRGKFDLNKVMEKYQSALSDEYLSVSEFNRFLPQGKSNLKRLFSDYGYELSAGSKPEQKFVDIALGGARLSGKLDRIDENAETMVVVDYKTGKGLSSLRTVDKSKQIQVWKYKLQLTFYQLLLQNSGRLKNNKNYEGKMVFLEASDQKYLELAYSPSSEDLQTLTRLIQVVWEKIMSLDFTDMSEYSKDYPGIEDFQRKLLNGYR